MDESHRKLIQRLWVKLLENITDYQGIIDGLHAENILTTSLREVVEQKKGKDQLRKILDILPKRGNRAFDVFYDVLVNCREDVAADLLCPERAAERKAKQARVISQPKGIQESGQYAPVSLLADDELPSIWPDAQLLDLSSHPVTKVPDGDRLMKELFQKASQGGGTVYAMRRKVRGIFLLISNCFFREARKNGHDLADREGTDKDELALKNLFTQLGFLVDGHFNRTKEEMLQDVQSVARKDHTEFDCFACAVLSHGTRENVYGIDGELLPLEALKDAIDGNVCHTLMGKPKLFFIQACQGERFDGMDGEILGAGNLGQVSKAYLKQEEFSVEQQHGLVRLRDNEECDAKRENRVSPKADFFTAMATIPDYVSWRNTHWGTWFIQAVVYVFLHLAYKYELTQLMTTVNRLVSKAETRKGLKQVSIYKSALTSHLYFFPGLNHEMAHSHSEIDVGKNLLTSPDPISTPYQSATEQIGQMTMSRQPGYSTDCIETGISVLVE